MWRNWTVAAGKGVDGSDGVWIRTMPSSGTGKYNALSSNATDRRDAVFAGASFKEILVKKEPAATVELRALKSVDSACTATHDASAVIHAYELESSN